MYTVIRLPPYHCELNPIELAWAAEKNFVAKENSEMKLESVEKLFRKKRNDLPREFWANCVEHVKKVEQSCRESDRIQDVQVEKLEDSFPFSAITDSDSETSLSAESNDNPHDKLVNSVNKKSCKVCSINFEPPGNDLCSACHVHPLSRVAWIISILIILDRFTWGLNYII